MPELTSAAVLIPVVDHLDDAAVLLTQRTDHLHDHAGQVSFPGGRVEPDDRERERDGNAVDRVHRLQIGLDDLDVRLVDEDLTEEWPADVEPGAEQAVAARETCFRLAEVAARTLVSSDRDVQTLASLQVDLTVLWDPAMHGTMAEPDLDGVDPARRSVLVMEGSKSAWAYNPEQSAVDLLDRQRVLRPPGLPWHFCELVTPPDEASLSNELKSGLRRILSGWPHPETRFAPAPPAQRQARHAQDIARALGGAVARPRQYWRDLQIDRWMHSLMMT